MERVASALELGLKRKARREASLAEERFCSRTALGVFRERRPPPYECAACRAAFVTHSQWTRHLDDTSECAPPHSHRPLFSQATASRQEVALSARVQRELQRFFDERCCVERAAARAKARAWHSADHLLLKAATRSVERRRCELRQDHSKCSGTFKRLFSKTSQDQRERDLVLGVQLANVTGQSAGVSILELTQLLTALRASAKPGSRAFAQTHRAAQKLAKDAFRTKLVDGDTLCADDAVAWYRRLTAANKDKGIDPVTHMTKNPLSRRHYSPPRSPFEEEGHSFGKSRTISLSLSLSLHRVHILH